jgi:hypothetical protein
LQQRPERPEAVAPLDEIRREAVVGVAPLALLADQPGVLQQPEVPRHAGLRDPEDAGQLADVQPLEAQQPQEPQPGLVPQQAVERGGIHIHESICMDV